MVGGVLASLAIAAALAAIGPPAGSPATCRHQSSAGFPAGTRDLVVGPLALVGGRVSSSAQDVARFGGMKYPAVLRAGHRAVVEIAKGESATTSLFYADADHGSARTGVADGSRVVDFRSCPPERAGSRYGGRRATFWSGFVLASKPRCVHLRIWVDGARTPRHARIELGRRCP
jgi:hypothetical protein